jgi:hypothetical protein
LLLLVAFALLAGAAAALAAALLRAGDLGLAAFPSAFAWLVAAFDTLVAFGFFLAAAAFGLFVFVLDI